MTLTGLEVRPDALLAAWADGAPATYPTLWLRDNCPSAFHPQTEERVLDLLTLDPAPVLQRAEPAGETLVLHYGDGHVSRMPLALLAAHRPGQTAADPAAIKPRLWRSDLTPAGVPRHAAAQIMAEPAALRFWMEETAAVGLAIVDGLDDRIDAGVDIACRIGFLRETNFGMTFEVVSKPDPNNLAYTAVTLPLHTDLPNQEVPPGFQFLHCLANEAQGGGSLFADGFALAEDLRSADPEAFRLLSEVAIPFRFHDGDADIRTHAPVITLSRSGAVNEIRWNAHIAATFDMAPEVMPDYYRAYRTFMAMTRNPAYQLTFKLKAGEMIVFDNRRVLHGREAFDPASGFRHLHGCYVDRGEFNSRLRLLAR
ncbi:TauD/TfdA family dioxygenase [Novosphingobium sp. PASSN1]|uniref:TauD/TfdA family dioxygenase n=1 Tax=Novosphingobium sp. PASSN1 TaxID=2015561 RepID=UPI000BDA5488|nr:TauD/TfdA family dioxygenase [Novosphingobium sp. PASSN1]OYU34589.1 MAG: gamma-butyrobetaine hydroxylase [Novosphingobium sp. PASSN1]